MQVCTSLQTDNHVSTPPLSFFTGWMPFLPPNQQRQSTEGKSGKFATNSYLKITLPCEISVFKKSSCSISNFKYCHVRLTTQKTLLFNLATKRRSYQPYKNSHYWQYTTAVTKKKMMQQNAVHDQKSVSY